MPRIHPRIVRQARRIGPLIERLLPVCRDVRSAQLELRWLREHASRREAHPQQIHRRLERYVWRRSHGEPLQYILGYEYFGALEIECRPCVLIPRQETATAVSYLVKRVTASRQQPTHLRILDACTGTGCIPLLFHHDFYDRQRHVKTSLRVVGLDISPTALSLARHNQRIQMRLQSGAHRLRQDSLASIQFLEADVLQDSTSDLEECPPSALEALQQLHGSTKGPSNFDMLISNPPYVSSEEYWRTTARSVRNYEPKLALVPRSTNTDQDAALHDGDVFYPRLLDIAERVDAKIVLFEVADFAQAKRVAAMTVERSIWKVVEIWRDYPDDESIAEQHIVIRNREVRVLGSGNGRSLFLSRGDGKQLFQP